MRNLNKPQLVNITKQKALENWFQSALGRSLLANQRELIASAVQNFFGVIQAEIGVSHRVPVGNPSNIAHKFFVIPEWSADLPSNVLISESDELSLDTGSVDLVILHHALDFSKNPHQTLREASRVLKSTGHLVIVGFNPTSLWGVRKLCNRNKQAPWNNRFISGNRLADWLNLLHFQVSDIEHHYYGLPFNKLGLLKQFLWLDNILNPKVPLGAYYILCAQKQTFSRIQNRQRWKPPVKAAGLSLSSSRNVYNITQKTHTKNKLGEQNN
jgi:SAM-dependent methyltransferase